MDIDRARLKFFAGAVRIRGNLDDAIIAVHKTWTPVKLMGETS